MAACTGCMLPRLTDLATNAIDIPLKDGSRIYTRSEVAVRTLTAAEGRGNIEAERHLTYYRIWWPVWFLRAEGFHRKAAKGNAKNAEKWEASKQ
jgi:hypothetical protein